MAERSRVGGGLPELWGELVAEPELWASEPMDGVGEEEEGKVPELETEGSRWATNEA